MAVTLYYTFGDNIYKSTYDFSIIIKNKEKIITFLVDHDSYYYADTDDIILDASLSNFEEEPVNCTWSCPDSFADLCSEIDLNDCRLEITNDALVDSTNFNSSIINHVHEFRL